jgi:hypothetical protein
VSLANKSSGVINDWYVSRKIFRKPKSVYVNPTDARRVSAITPHKHAQTHDTNRRKSLAPRRPTQPTLTPTLPSLFRSLLLSPMHDARTVTLVVRDTLDELIDGGGGNVAGRALSARTAFIGDVDALEVPRLIPHRHPLGRGGVLAVRIPLQRQRETDRPTDRQT